MDITAVALLGVTNSSNLILKINFLWDQMLHTTVFKGPTTSIFKGTCKKNFVCHHKDL